MERTLGQLARHFNTRPANVSYAITSRDIRPTRRVGGLRLFSERETAKIEKALQEIANSGRGHPAKHQGSKKRD